MCLCTLCTSSLQGKLSDIAVLRRWRSSLLRIGLSVWVSCGMPGAQARCGWISTCIQQFLSIQARLETSDDFPSSYSDLKHLWIYRRKAPFVYDRIVGVAMIMMSLAQQSLSNRLYLPIHACVVPPSSALPNLDGLAPPKPPIGAARHRFGTRALGIILRVRLKDTRLKVMPSIVSEYCRMLLQQACAVNEIVLGPQSPKNRCGF
jgi:hypothetical protein